MLLAALHAEGFLLLDAHSPPPVGAHAGTSAQNCKMFAILFVFQLNLSIVCFSRQWCQVPSLSSCFLPVFLAAPEDAPCLPGKGLRAGTGFQTCTGFSSAPQQRGLAALLQSNAGKGPSIAPRQGHAGLLWKIRRLIFYSSEAEVVGMKENTPWGFIPRVNEFLVLL